MLRAQGSCNSKADEPTCLAKDAEDVRAPSPDGELPPIATYRLYKRRWVGLGAIVSGHLLFPEAVVLTASYCRCCSTLYRAWYWYGSAQLQMTVSASPVSTSLGAHQPDL